MNIIKFVKLTLAASIICILSNAYCFDTKAPYAFMADYKSGQILYQKNSDQRLHPSSMTKIMTAFVVFDKIKNGEVELTDLVKISQNARSMEGSRMFLEQGEKVSIKDLLLGLIVQSGNDAAVALAEAVSGSEADFAVEMNKYAADIGLENSHFQNSSGLSDDDHYTTAYDLYLLSHKLIDYFPGFYEMFKMKNFVHNNISQNNRNLALGKLGIDGLKTGHTDAGGYGIALSAKQNDRRLIAVINGLDSEAERLKESLKIISHGLFDFTKKQLITIDDPKYTQKIPVRYGDRNFVTASLEGPIWVYVQTGQEIEFEVHIKHLDNITAPIAKGQVLGQVLVKDVDGNDVAEADLIANAEIKKTNAFRRIWLNVKYLLN